MKKIFVIFILTFSSIHSYTQYQITKDSLQNQYLISKLDSMGIDNKHYLNQYESEYFNMKFEKGRGDFDFANKKVAFFNSSGGSVFKSKVDYFTTEKDRLLRNSSSNVASLVLFNEEQKQENGGYDAVVYYWSKILRDAKFYMKKLKAKVEN